VPPGCRRYRANPRHSGFFRSLLLETGVRPVSSEEEPGSGMGAEAAAQWVAERGSSSEAAGEAAGGAGAAAATAAAAAPMEVEEEEDEFADME
jgi:hypothetical protein